MKGSFFLDTNVLVYAYSENEPDKRLMAQHLILDKSSLISTQVLQEFSNVLRKRFKKSWKEIASAIEEISESKIVYINNKDTTIKAIKIAEEYGFSFYDSLIISAAIESDCSKLYSEDMNNGQLIRNTLQIVNPF